MSNTPDRLLLVVVGAPLEAERIDRPLALQLSATITAIQNDLEVSDPYEIITCTDVWFLNDAGLLSHPVISIGRPQSNAATAFLAGRLPTALIVDHAYRIHFDTYGVEQQACIWGTNAVTTRAAVDAFHQRYLNCFLRLAHDLPQQAN